MRGDNRKKNSFHFSFRWMNFVSPCFALSSLRALWLYQFWFICVRLLVSRFCATRARPCIPISGSMAQSANDQRLRKRKQKMFLFFFLREAKGDFERCELRIVSHFAVTKSSRMCFTNPKTPNSQHWTKNSTFLVWSKVARTNVRRHQIK